MREAITVRPEKVLGSITDLERRAAPRETLPEG